MLNTTFTNATDRMLVRNKHFEVQYAEMLENLMINGTYSDDRTGVGTQRIQSDVIHIPANQIPLMVGKKIMPENAFTEIIWMLKGDTNIKFLKEHGVNYWDSWADENGDLGAVYGKQFRDFNGEDQYRDNINDLILNPDSRRIISELWNVSDLQAMSLTPCFTEKKNAVRKIGGIYSLIENIQIGDYVLSDDGTYQKVYDKFITPYKGNIFNFKHKLNMSGIESTPNHPFLIMGKGFVNAENVKVGDYFGITFPKTDKEISEYRVDWDSPNSWGTFNKKSFTIKNDYEWYFMGYFLGNGWLIKKSNRTYIAIPHTKTDDILKNFGDTINLCHQKNSGKNCSKYSMQNMRWANILSKFGTGAKEKCIPDFIFESSEEKIRAFIDGYIDADGCETETYFSATTVSKNIAYGIQSLCAKVGYVCKVHFSHREPTCVIEGRTVNQNHIYGIYIYKNIDEDIIIDTKNGITWSKIKKIETKLYDGNVHNISVENTHTYTTNNVINHNCHKTYHLTSFINHAGKRVVDLHMSQRSADIFLGVPYNFMLAYYYLHIACYMTDSTPNEIHITFNDLHLYDTHREQAQKYLDRIKEDKDNLLSLVIENGFAKENSYMSITPDFEAFTSKEIDDKLNYLFNSYDKIFKPKNYKHYSFLKAQIAV